MVFNVMESVNNTEPDKGAGEGKVADTSAFPGPPGIVAGTQLEAVFQSSLSVGVQTEAKHP